MVRAFLAQSQQPQPVRSLPMKEGHATGEYEDFLTGFVTADGEVWGRPVGVAVAQDGSLIVTDDGSNSVWRVSYYGFATREYRRGGPALDIAGAQFAA